MPNVGLKMQQSDLKLFKDHEYSIANELANIRGQECLLYPWELPDPTYYCLDLIPRNGDRYQLSFPDDSTRSGGVHSLIREYLSATTKHSETNLAKIPIQKDFLFVPTIESKYLKHRQVVAMSTMATARKRSSIRSLLKVGRRHREAGNNLTEFILAPHPVHWVCTKKYQQFLPDVWAVRNVCLVMLPKSTPTVRREISPEALQRVVASIRKRGLSPIACVYPDQQSLLAYYSLLQIQNLFDDIVIAGPVTSLYQMIKLLTYIDASAELCIPECDDDPIGPLSLAAILGVYRHKYVSIVKEDIHVFINQSKRAQKVYRRYPSPAELTRIKMLSADLGSSTSTTDQVSLLMANQILDVLPKQHSAT
jgi:hypothetical protein